jgi:hypothetical protein
MPAPLFIDYSPETPITAAWLNSVSNLLWNVLGDGNNLPANGDQLATNLKLISYHDTIADLRALTTVPSAFLSTRGYHRVGDGAANMYVVAPTGTVATDNGGTVIVTAGGTILLLASTEHITSRTFGTVGDGVTDDTAAMQSYLNSGLKSWHVPEGVHLCSELVIPFVENFCFYGDGPSSQIKIFGNGIHFPTLANNCFDSHATIRDLYLDGSLGTANLLDSTYTQTLNIERIFVNNVPVGFSGVKLDGNPNSSTYAHDVRVTDLRVYSHTAGNAGLALGSFHSDASVTRYQMEGYFNVNYGVYMSSGASTTTFTDSHIYNAKQNIVFCAGNNTACRWDSVTFDNAQQDLFYLAGSIQHEFDGCYFESVNPGKSAIVCDNSYQNNWMGTTFNSLSGGSLSCFREVNGASQNTLEGGSMGNSADWSNMFQFLTITSWAKGFPGYAPYGSAYALTSATGTGVPQGTTTNLGAAGANASIGNTAWPAPFDGYLRFGDIYSVPAVPAGQSVSVAIQVNGFSEVAGTIGGGGSALELIPTAPVFVSKGTPISFSVTTSAGAGTLSFRYSIAMFG